MVTSIKTLLVTILFRPQVFTEACHSSLRLPPHQDEMYSGYSQS